MNCIRKTAFGAKNLRISNEVGMMPTVVSVRHGEHPTSTSRIGVLTPVDDRGILLYIPTRAPSPASGIYSSTSWDRWSTSAGKPVSTSEPRFLSKLECEGSSVEAGPEGRGTLTRRSDVVSNKNMQPIPRNRSRCYRSSQLHRHPLLHIIIERVDLVCKRCVRCGEVENPCQSTSDEERPIREASVGEVGQYTYEIDELTSMNAYGILFCISGRTSPTAFVVDNHETVGPLLNFVRGRVSECALQICDHSKIPSLIQK